MLSTWEIRLILCKSITVDVIIMKFSESNKLEQIKIINIFISFKLNLRLLNDSNICNSRCII